MRRNKKSLKIKKQKMYKMRGCSKKNRCKKNYLGGMSLAYPSDDVKTVPNPHLAYTGKGGASSCPMGITPTNASMPQNINAENPAYPNSGPPSNGFNFLNSIGGSIFNPSCQRIHVVADYSKKGGSCGGTCSATNGMTGGSSHRNGCKCSSCRGHSMKGGNAGIPYPNGLTGNAYTPGNVQGWPGVNGIQGDSNHYSLNTYNNDISRQMVDLGAAPPFTGGRKKTKTKSKNKKGGGLTNFLFQDLVNLGRQFQYNVGSAYNGLQGYSSPVNPAPWKDQLPNTTNLASIKAFHI